MVKTYVTTSTINGLGLFAGEKIYKGKIIWEYFPLIDITYSLKEWNELRINLTTESFSMIRRYAYKEKDKFIVCMDNAQFMNHFVTEPNVANTEDLNSMFALRTIEKGEELVCDYMEYSDPDDFHVKNLKRVL